MRQRAPKRAPKTPDGLFEPAECFVLHVANDLMGTEVYGDILDACERQREFDPKLTWIVRYPDGAVLKVRNGSSAQLRQLVARFGGHV